MESEKVKQEEAAKNRQLHARDVRKQVREKEEGKIASRRAFFDEGVRLDFEAKERSVAVGEGGVTVAMVTKTHSFGWSVGDLIVSTDWLVKTERTVPMKIDDPLPFYIN